jgi:hypothetical protein
MPADPTIRTRTILRRPLALVSRRASAGSPVQVGDSIPACRGVHFCMEASNGSAVHPQGDSGEVHGLLQHVQSGQILSLRWDSLHPLRVVALPIRLPAEEGRANARHSIRYAQRYAGGKRTARNSALVRGHVAGVFPFDADARGANEIPGPANVGVAAVSGRRASLLPPVTRRSNRDSIGTALLRRANNERV